MGLCKVHVWLPSEDNSWGHASIYLSLYYQENYHHLCNPGYISFWPGNATNDKKRKKGLGMLHANAAYNKSLIDDIEDLGTKKYHCIDLDMSGIQERNVMLKWWSIFNNRSAYSAIDNNCCTVVANCLENAYDVDHRQFKSISFIKIVTEIAPIGTSRPVEPQDILEYALYLKRSA